MNASSLKANNLTLQRKTQVIHQIKGVPDNEKQKERIAGLKILKFLKFCIERKRLIAEHLCRLILNAQVSIQSSHSLNSVCIPLNWEYKIHHLFFGSFSNLSHLQVKIARQIKLFNLRKWAQQGILPVRLYWTENHSNTKIKQKSSCKCEVVGSFTQPPWQVSDYSVYLLIMSYLAINGLCEFILNLFYRCKSRCNTVSNSSVTMQMSCYKATACLNSLLMASSRCQITIHKLR